MKKDIKQDLKKFKVELRKYYIKTMTSEKFYIPADSKEVATFKWMEVSVCFDGALEKFLKTRQKD